MQFVRMHGARNLALLNAMDVRNALPVDGSLISIDRVRGEDVLELRLSSNFDCCVAPLMEGNGKGAQQGNGQRGAA